MYQVSVSSTLKVKSMKTGYCFPHRCYFQGIDLRNINICSVKSSPRHLLKVAVERVWCLTAEAISWATDTHCGQEGPLGGKAWSCAEWAWTSFLAVSQKQAKEPGPPLKVYEHQLVPGPLPLPAPFSFLGGWRRLATHKTKQPALPWPLWCWIRSLNPWQEKTGGHSAALQTVCLEALWKFVHTGCQERQVGWEYGGDSIWRRRGGWLGFFTGGKTSSWVYRKRLKGMWRRKSVHPQRSSRPRDSRAERNNGSLCLLPGLPFTQHHPGMWGPEGSHPGATGSLGLSRLGSQKRPWLLFLMKKDLF